MKIRIAQNSDGPRIGELARHSGFTVNGLDWSEVHPFWLVAEREGKVVGAINLILSRPIGWLEILSLDPGLSDKDRARAVKALVLAGKAALKRFGAQMAMGSVPHELKAYKKALKKRGAVVCSSGNVMASRL